MSPENDPANTPVMEIVSFRLQDGTNAKDFQNAARAIDRLLRERGTASARTLVCDADGLWTDIVQWRNMDEAQAAAEDLVKDPAFAPFGAMIAPGSVQMRHAAIRHQME